MSITFTTLPPFADISRLKEDAKRLAKLAKLAHHEALDRLARERFDGLSWHELKTSHTATLLDRGRVLSRLKAGPEFEITFHGFGDHFSGDYTTDIVSSAVIGDIAFRSISQDPRDSKPVFRVVCDLMRAEDSWVVEYEPMPLASYFGPEEDGEPLRRRLGPMVAALRRYTEDALEGYRTVNPRDKPRDSSMEPLEAALDIEDQVALAEKLHGMGAAVWAAKAAIAQAPAAPRAWLALAMAERDSDDRVRTFIEKGLASIDIAYWNGLAAFEVDDDTSLRAVETNVSLLCLEAESLARHGDERGAAVSLAEARQLADRNWFEEPSWISPDRVGLILPPRVEAILNAGRSA